MILNTIRNALITDFGDITTGNGYSVTLAEISEDPKRPDEMLRPGVCLYSGEAGTVERETNSGRINTSFHDYVVQMVAVTATPNETLDNMTDDVRNVVELSTSAVLNASTGPAAVIDVNVTNISPVLTDTNANEERTFVRILTVEVQYEYTRGSA